MQKKIEKGMNEKQSQRSGVSHWQQRVDVKRIKATINMLTNKIKINLNNLNATRL